MKEQKKKKDQNISRYLVALLKNTTDFKRFLSNLQEKKGKGLNRLT